MNDQSPRSRRTQVPIILIAIIVICSGVELVLTAADYGWIASTGLRRLVYGYGGFWPGLLNNWSQNFPAQKWTMFLSYAFLHGGIAHLIMNMITLYSLGVAVIDRIGAKGFFLMYLGSMLGGAVCYGYLAETPQPMVGASGALFGLAGGLIAWLYTDRRSARRNLAPVFKVAAYLLGINVVMFWVLAGQLAWQTHLGGFVVGLFLGFALDTDEHKAA
ncbi:MAG: rhomboid protease GluP [Paracoccaceae bacterium]|jgi:membrane associated rhomboid family serine protease